jgi:hypothetical protein
MISNEDFLKIVNQSKTMAIACKNLGMSFSSFKRKALKLGCYKPNQGSKGCKKPKTNLIKTEDILQGKYPEYQTYKLKVRMIKEGYLKDECSICGWTKKPENADLTPCELDHIDGNPTNHLRENLRLLCPNCHSLTRTYSFRRGKTNFEQLGRKLLTE